MIFLPLSSKDSSGSDYIGKGKCVIEEITWLSQVKKKCHKEKAMVEESRIQGQDVTGPS